MLIKSCLAHLCHLPGFDQVGHSPLGNQWGVAILVEGQGVSVWLHLCTSSDCFEWGLIDDIDQQRVHSFYWQFQMGGIEGGPSEGMSSENLNSFLVLLLLYRVFLFLYIEMKDQSVFVLQFFMFSLHLSACFSALYLLCHM